jgi:RHS repeat-associated protein
LENTGRTENYNYDPIYRLLGENIAGDPVSTNNGLLNYSLDAVGNRSSLTSTLPALQSQSFTYDNDDRISSDVFDNNGNTTQSNGVTYTYEFEDRLVGTSTGVQITYDGDGNRVSETAGGVTTKFLVDEHNPTGYAQVAEEIVGGALTVQYTHGLLRISQRRSGTVSYYGYDGGASVRQLFDNTGTVTDTYAYDAFGNTVARTGTTVNSYQYRGEQFDAVLQMYYLRARYYIPRTGRFLTADSYEGGELSACDCSNRNKWVPPIGTHHLFGYAGSDPVDQVDPSGQGFFEFATVQQVVAGGLILITISAAIVEPILCLKEYLDSLRALRDPVIAPQSSLGCAEHEHQEPPEPGPHPPGPTPPWLGGPRR